MSARLHREDGWVLIPGMVLLVLMLGLGLAVLAIVDTQSSASSRERADNVTFNTAEGVARSAALVLGAGDLWQGTASRTRSGEATARCGAPEQTYDADADNAFGKALQRVIAQGYDSRAGTWTVNVCRVEDPVEEWADGHLQDRVAFAATTAPARDLLWVRGQTTVAGTTRAVALKVRATRVALPFPPDFAIRTGSFGTSDLRSTTGTLLSDGIIGDLVSGILNTKPLIEDSAAKIAVRCGLLHLTSGQLCLSGALAGVSGTADMLGVSPLNELLATNRFTQENTWQVATQEQLEAWRAEAEATGTYVASRAAGTECFSPADQTGKVVWIEQVGDGTGRCDVTGTRRAKVLVVARGRVRVTGSFTGILYVANRNADGAPDRSDPGRESVYIQGGHVRGAVYVDGTGSTRIELPRVDCGLLGLNCVLGDVLGLLGLVPDYTAIQRDTSVIAAAAPSGTRGAAAVPGGFRQVAHDG